MAAPWVSYGQTTIQQGTNINNPTGNAAGVRGEVQLPYTVPAGLRLRLTSWGVEGAFGTTALFPWLGTSTPTNAKALPTALANGCSNAIHGHWVLPAGTTVNVFLTYIGTSTAAVEGWWIQGELEAA